MLKHAFIQTLCTSLRLVDLNNYLNIASSVKQSDPKDFLKAQLVIFRCQKYVKKRVHGNESTTLPGAFKYYVYDSNVKYCDLKDFLKAQFVIFRCQKYVKKGCMEMGEQLYLEP